MQQRIHIITLGVRNFQRALTFYEEGLEWKKSALSTPQIAFFDCGGLLLALYPYEQLASDALQAPKEDKGFPGFTLAHNAPDKASVDRVLTQAVAAGGKLIKSAKEVFWGGYSGYFRDPEGFLWEVAYNPMVGFDAAGGLEIT